jgi:hypothetical protein
MLCPKGCCSGFLLPEGGVRLFGKGTTNRPKGATMIDLLSKRLVMLGNDEKQSLDDDQLYLCSDDEGDVEDIEFSIGPSLLDAGEPVKVTIRDLDRALQQFGYTLDRLV